MNTASVRFEQLTKDNYDTWKIQMKAVLIKNDAWGYANDTRVKPENHDAGAEEVVNRWTDGDLEAQSDIILMISP